MSRVDYDVLVVGGGPAGASQAQIVGAVVARGGAGDGAPAIGAV